MRRRALVKIFGTKSERDLKQIQHYVDDANRFTAEFEKLSDDELKAKTQEFRNRLEKGETLDDILPEAFAVVRLAAQRVIGLRPYDVQLLGGIVLHQGKIAEMRTGEGKTLVAVLPSYLNGLTGKGVHVVTVNDYLAHRDREWMGPIHEFLGLSVGYISHDMNEAKRWPWLSVIRTSTIAVLSPTRTHRTFSRVWFALSLHKSRQDGLIRCLFVPISWRKPFASRIFSCNVLTI